MPYKHLFIIIIIIITIIIIIIIIIIKRAMFLLVNSHFQEKESQNCMHKYIVKTSRR